MGSGPKKSWQKVFEEIKEIVDEAIEDMPENDRELRVDLVKYVAWSDHNDLSQGVENHYRNAGWSYVKLTYREGDYQGSENFYLQLNY